MSGSRVGSISSGSMSQAHAKVKKTPSSFARKKRIERMRSEQIKETLQKLIDSIETPDGIRGVTARGLEDRARRQRKTVDLDLLLADSIDVVKYILATTSADPDGTKPNIREHDASMDVSQARHHHAFLRSAWRGSDMVMSMVVRTSDLVVVESSRAVHIFQPCEQFSGYVGQSLWYHTDWRDHDVIGELRSNISAGTALGETRRVRLRRVMQDENTPNLLYSYMSQTVKILHVADDGSYALMAFEPSSDSHSPLATDQAFWNMFDNAKLSVLRPNSYVALKEIDEDVHVAKKPNEGQTIKNIYRLLDVASIFNKFHAWLTALVIHSCKLVFCYHRDMSGPEKGLARLSCFRCDGADSGGIGDLEPFWEFNFRHDNSLYLSKSGLEPFYIRHALRVVEDGADDCDGHAQHVLGDVNLIIVEGAMRKPIVFGFGETLRLPERHLCRILTPTMFGQRPSLFQMEYLADPEHASVSNSDTIRVREMATLMGTLCELRQFLWTSHGDFDAKF